jgi:hypothetical protein
LLLAALLAGCAMQEMDAGGEADVGNHVSVTPEAGFAQIHLATIRYWTRNGTGLDELGFYTGIKSGEPLFPVPGVAKKDLPVFQARMTPNDIEDLAASSLAKKHMQNVRTLTLHPCPFGSAPGFCFDLAFANEEGLEMRGRAIARQQNGLLDLVIFTARRNIISARCPPRWTGYLPPSGSSSRDAPTGHAKSRPVLSRGVGLGPVMGCCWAVGRICVLILEKPKNPGDVPARPQAGHCPLRDGQGFHQPRALHSHSGE